MKAILSLVEDHGLRPVDDFVGHFLSPMGREAMHEYGLGFCSFHQPGVDLVRLKYVVPALAATVSHRHPGVRHNAIRLGDRAFGVLPDANGGARGSDPIEQRLLGSEFRRSCNRELELKLMRRMHPGCKYV